MRDGLFVFIEIRWSQLVCLFLKCNSGVRRQPLCWHNSSAICRQRLCDRVRTHQM